jgi:hypothetical protein
VRPGADFDRLLLPRELVRVAVLAIGGGAFDDFDRRACAGSNQRTIDFF